MMVVVMKEKEVIERNRQMLLIKQYFGRRREVFEERQHMFLKMYPYNGLGRGADLSKFNAIVKKADLRQMDIIIRAFQREKDYWNSTYVVNNCNCSVHAHIISTLEAMEKNLSNMCYSFDDTIASVNQNIELMEKSAPKSKSAKSTTISKNIVDGNHWGRIGEESVDYVLKWLPDMYYVIEKDCHGKYDNNVILLENTSFIDEAQEFDHLVIGPQGIFNIETKNYTGKLSIDENNNWFRLKKGETEWGAEENPAQQLFRHHILLQSIVGEGIPIVDIICMAHPNLMIVGQENSFIPVVKRDLLADFIVNYRPAKLSKDQIRMIKNKINRYKISK